MRNEFLDNLDSAVVCYDLEFLTFENFIFNESFKFKRPVWRRVWLYYKPVVLVSFVFQALIIWWWKSLKHPVTMGVWKIIGKGKKTAL